MPCPSLERICIEVLAWSPEPYFQLQKRRMQLLPEHVANTLMQLLLQFRRLQSPSQLDAFRDCLTTLTITAATGLHLDAEWLAHICSLRHLQSLTIRDMPKLRDKALTSLPAAASRLVHLDLSGCSGLTNKSLHLLGQLTNLASLNLTGTSVKSPLLAELLPLAQQLTQLHLGGCAVTDADITRNMPVFVALQDLSLWGCAAGDASAHCIAHSLPSLSALNMSWSQVTCTLPLLPSLTLLDLSHCKLRGSDADLVAAMGMQQLQVLLLAHVEVDAWGCEVLEALLRSSAPALEVLDLTGASLGNPLPLLLALEPAVHLSALSLSGTKLIDDYLPALSPCSSLHTLNLSANPGITAAGLSATLPGFAHQLQRLDLTGTGVGNAVLPLLKHLPQLQQLVLAHTGISWESKAGAEGGVALGVEEAGLQAVHHQHQGVQGPNRLHNGPIGPHGFPDRPVVTGVTLTEVPISQVQDPRPPAAGWPQLQLLDVTNTQLTDAGCIQLAAELTAAAAAGSRAAGGVGPGLRVLHVGSSACKLGRKTLAGLCHLTSLQQLKLQDWGLSNRDLSQLYPLQQLRQLTIKGSDPWLISDAALQQLPEELPLLSSIIRDGQQLLPYGVHAQAATGCVSQAAPAGPADSGSSFGGHSSTAAGCASHNSSTGGFFSGSTSSGYQGIWQGPQMVLSGDLKRGMQGIESPWLLQYLPQPTSPGGNGKLQQQHTPASRGMLQQLPVSSRSSGRANADRRSSSSGDGSRGGTVYQRLSAYDERYKYSSEELLALRDVCEVAGGDGHSSESAGSSDSSRRSSSPGTLVSLPDIQKALPDEIRAGARW